MKISANIPDVLYQQLESFAKKEQIFIDGLVTIALSLQIGLWSTRDYLKEKAKRVNWEAFEKVLAKVPNRPVEKQKQCLEQILLFPSVFKKGLNRSSISQPHST